MNLVEVEVDMLLRSRNNAKIKSDYLNRKNTVMTGAQSYVILYQPRNNQNLINGNSLHPIHTLSP